MIKDEVNVPTDIPNYELRTLLKKLMGDGENQVVEFWDTEKFKKKDCECPPAYLDIALRLSNRWTLLWNKTNEKPAVFDMETFTWTFLNINIFSIKKLSDFYNEF